MGNGLYLVAVILLIIWGVSFIGFNVGGMIHILLVVALIVVIFRLIKGKRVL